MNHQLVYNYFLEKYCISISTQDIEVISQYICDAPASADILKEVYDFYNANRNKMPKAEVFSQSRQSAIKGRIKDYGLNKVKDVLFAASKSDFLNGKNAQEWKASIDWILKPTNFVKILEGNFKNIEHGKQSSVNGNQNGRKGADKVDGTSQLLNGQVRYFEPS